MVNRSDQAKLRRSAKRGRHSRHSDAKLKMPAGTTLNSFINSKSSGPVRAEMELMKARTGNALFRTRAGSIVINHRQTDEFFRYMEARYPTFRYSKTMIKEMGLPDEYGVIRNNPVPRGLVFRKADELLKETDITMHFRLVAKPDHSIDLFFNAAKTKWFALEINRTIGLLRKSAVYSSKESIIAILKGKPLWVYAAMFSVDDGNGDDDGREEV